MFQLIAAGLREGVDTQPAFDRRATVVYSIMAAELLVGAVASVIAGFSYRLSLVVVAPALTLIGCAWLLRRIGQARTADGMEITSLALVQGLPTIFIIFPLLTISGPYADNWLEHADRALGFDWRHFIAIFKGHNRILDVIVVAYRSLFLQPLVILPALVASGHSGRAWACVTALSVALVAALAIYPFAPAVAAFTHFGVSQGDFPLSSTVPWTTGPIVHSFKEGARVVTDQSLKGLITFPSYHAAVALLFTWAAWPLRPLRYPLIAVNTVMLLSCIIVGAHYLVDVIAGVGIGLASANVAPRLVAAAARAKNCA